MEERVDSYRKQLSEVVERVCVAVSQFQKGNSILVGDDGKRENEADVAFHAQFADPKKVNFALKHARGLLCVSVSHEVADRLAFHAAPKLPGGIPNTGFTLSVDAAKNITSGISARDRAEAIRLMAEPSSTPADFISPGHMFPVRALEGGLYTRAGHTEALQEICSLAGLSGVAAMCEVLDDEGEGLPPIRLERANDLETERSEQLEGISALPYVSTVDLLLYKVFVESNNQFDSKAFEKIEDNFFTLDTTHAPDSTLTLATNLKVNPDAPDGTINVTYTNGAERKESTQEKARYEVFILDSSPRILSQTLSEDIESFFDLSQSTGIGQSIAVKRAVSVLKVLQFINSQFNENFKKDVTLPISEDTALLRATL